MSSNCYVDPIEKKVAPEAYQNARRAALAVSGMGCPNCALRVRNSLIELEGVLEAQVDHNYGQALVIFNPQNTTLADLVAAVARAGQGNGHHYGAQLMD
jgi:copper chaperone CopZ